MPMKVNMSIKLRICCKVNKLFYPQDNKYVNVPPIELKLTKCKKKKKAPINFSNPLN